MIKYEGYKTELVILPDECNRVAPVLTLKGGERIVLMAKPEHQLYIYHDFGRIYVLAENQDWEHIGLEVIDKKSGTKVAAYHLYHWKETKPLLDLGTHLEKITALLKQSVFQ